MRNTFSIDPQLGKRVTGVGEIILRYGLVTLVLWFGAFKFTAVEADAIMPLVSNSPLLSWMYQLGDVRTVSRMIGSMEIVIALSIAARPLSATVAAAGSMAAVGMFVTTLSFLVTTPGMFTVAEGLPVPAGAGPFVVKDIMLLGASVWSLGEALHAVASAKRSGAPAAAIPGAASA